MVYNKKLDFQLNQNFQNSITNILSQCWYCEKKLKLN